MAAGNLTSVPVLKTQLLGAPVAHPVERIPLRLSPYRISRVQFQPLALYCMSSLSLSLSLSSISPTFSVSLHLSLSNEGKNGPKNYL